MRSVESGLKFQAFPANLSRAIVATAPNDKMRCAARSYVTWRTLTPCLAASGGVGIPAPGQPRVELQCRYEVRSMAATVMVRDPEILGGIPCFLGTRVPFQNLLDYLEAGDSQRVAPGEDRMKILLDECPPRDLRKHLVGHDCDTVPRAGFSGKANGELLALAERSG